MSLSSLKLILEKFPDFEGNVALSDTGDPLILADLPERLGMIRAAWPKCHLSLTSTLTVRRSAQWFRRLYAAGLNQIMLSLYAFNSEDYLKYQGSSKFNNVIENIKAISTLPENLRKKLILKKLSNFGTYYKIDNYGEQFNSFFDKFKTLGFTRYWQDSLIPVVHDNTETKKYNSPIPCSVVWGGMAGTCEIRANLDVVPCCLFPGDKVRFGNLAVNTPEEIFNSQAYRQFQDAWTNMEIEKIAGCKQCKCYNTGINAEEEYEGIAAWIGERLNDCELVLWAFNPQWEKYLNHFNRLKITACVSDGSGSVLLQDIPSIKPEMLNLEAYKNLPLLIFAPLPITSKILIFLKNYCHKSISQIFTIPPTYAIDDQEGYYYDVTNI